jgi:magnesium-transporting ATPase (P-type)
VPLAKPSPTDEAMMYMIRGCNFEKSDTICQEVSDKYSHKSLTPFFFTSGRKRMTSFSTNLDDPADDYNCRAQMKGASEKVLLQCNKYMNAEGKVVDLDDAARKVIGD